jgi:N-acetylneuraminic acid mutarotase
LLLLLGGAAAARTPAASTLRGTTAQNAPLSFTVAANGRTVTIGGRTIAECQLAYDFGDPVVSSGPTAVPVSTLTARLRANGTFAGHLHTSRSTPEELSRVTVDVTGTLNRRTRRGAGTLRVRTFSQDPVGGNTTTCDSGTVSWGVPSAAFGRWRAAGRAPFEPIATALLADGRVLTIGVAGRRSLLNPAAIYDPRRDRWIAVAGMPGGGRSGETATTLQSGRVLVVGGEHDVAAPLATTEVYDPRANRWIAGGRLGLARESHTATLLRSGQVLVAGGSVPRVGGTARAELYDATSNRWSAAPDMPAPTLYATASRLEDGRVLIAGTGTDARSSAIFDPATGTWRNGPAMTRSQSGAAAALIDHGRVLVFGGRVDFDAGAYSLTGAEIYDPATDTWTATPAPSPLEHAGRSDIAILSDGRVLALGEDRAASTPGAETYDPATGRWTRTDPMVAPRSAAHVIALRDGRALAIGGAGYNPFATAELYTP